MNFFEGHMVTTMLACIRGQGPFKKYQEVVFKALMRPYHLSIKDDDLQLLKRETLEEQLAAFEKTKARKRQPRKERVSA